MQVAVKFDDEVVAQKVLWILDHFKDEGVEVIKLDDSDEEIEENLKNALSELDLVKKGKLSAKSVEEFLDEL